MADRYEQLQKRVADMEGELAELKEELEQYDHETGRSQANAEANEQRRTVRGLAWIGGAGLAAAAIREAIRGKPVAAATTAIGTAAAIVLAVTVIHDDPKPPRPPAARGPQPGVTRPDTPPPRPPKTAAPTETPPPRPAPAPTDEPLPTRLPTLLPSGPLLPDALTPAEPIELDPPSAKPPVPVPTEPEVIDDPTPLLDLTLVVNLRRT